MGQFLCCQDGWNSVQRLFGRITMVEVFGNVAVHGRVHAQARDAGVIRIASSSHG